MMSAQHLSVYGTRRALIVGIRRVIAQREEINRINVFPIADRDTGTNLAFTLGAVLQGLREPRFATAGDVLRFFTAMADGGAPVLTPDEVAQLSSPALTDEQYRAGAPIIGGGLSWGLGTGVDVEATRPWMTPGRWGWTGGTGTTAHVDPVRGVVAVLLTQRMMAGAHDGPEDFWTAVAGSATVEP